MTHIRKSTLRDYDQLVMLNNSCPMDLYPHREEQRRLLGFPSLLAFDVVGSAIGVVVWTPIIARPDDFHIEVLFVRKEKRKLGIGHELMKFAEEFAVSEGYRNVTLYTLDDGVNGWFEKLGYGRDRRDKALRPLYRKDVWK